MPTVSITYGKITFPKASAVIAAFSVKPPYIRVLASKAHPKVGGTTRHAAGNQPHDGFLVTECVNVPEDTILLLQMQRRQGGCSIADGAIFLRVRAKAALVSVTALLPRYHGSALGDRHSVFEGRADVLTVKDLPTVGIDPGSNYLRGFCNQEEIDECYSIRELWAAVAPAPRNTVVTSSTGEIVVLQADTRVRRMRVRKA